MGVLTAICLVNRELTAQTEPGSSGWCMAREKKGMGACMETRLLQTGQEENLSEAARQWGREAVQPLSLGLSGPHRS